jgi:signal peptidase I
VRGFTRTAILIAAIVGAIGFLLHLFFFDTWTFPRGDAQLAASVLPALKADDTVLLRRGTAPRYGELARCASPITSGAFVVGRVVGSHGDRVQVEDTVVTTNGKALASRHGCPQVIVTHPVTEALVTMTCGVAETGAWSFEFLTSAEMHGGTSLAVVEAGKLFLVSDNRLMHQDSRDFGQVEESTCEHIVYRLWGEKFTDASRRFTILW